jgi:hypothetical protein
MIEALASQGAAVTRTLSPERTTEPSTTASSPIFVAISGNDCVLALQRMTDVREIITQRPDLREVADERVGYPVGGTIAGWRYPTGPVEAGQQSI